MNVVMRFIKRAEHCRRYFNNNVVITTRLRAKIDGSRNCSFITFDMGNIFGKIFVACLRWTEILLLQRQLFPNYGYFVSH